MLLKIIISLFAVFALCLKLFTGVLHTEDAVEFIFKHQPDFANEMVVGSYTQPYSTIYIDELGIMAEPLYFATVRWGWIALLVLAVGLWFRYFTEKRGRT